MTTTLLEYKQVLYHTTDLKSRALSVLLYLVDRADYHEFTCFPSITTIGKNLNISVSTVKRAMKELLEKGYVERKARFSEQKNGGQTSNLYTLCLPTEEKLETKVLEEVATEELERVEERELVEEIIEVERVKAVGGGSSANRENEVEYITFEDLKQGKRQVEEEGKLDKGYNLEEVVIKGIESKQKEEVGVETRSIGQGDVPSIWSRIREKMLMCGEVAFEKFARNGLGRDSN